MKIPLSELAAYVDGVLALGPDREIQGLCSIEERDARTATHLSFWLPERPPRELLRSAVQSFLVAKLPERAAAEPALATKSFVVVRHPELAFARILTLFHPRPVATEHSVHPAASVAPDVVFDGPVRVGPCAVLESGVRVGGGTVIEGGCYVGTGVVMGRDCVLHGNSVIQHHCVLGDRVILHSGAVIGADGFGYTLDGARWVKLEQIGRVVLGDDVEVGANTCIDRGALRDTVVGNGTKIDDLCMVGHNCTFGENVVIAGLSGFAGSTRVGDRCRFGGMVGATGHIEVGSDLAFAAKTGVMRTMKKPGVYSGTPAIPQRERMRIYVEERRLIEYRRRLRELEDRLRLLEQRASGESADCIAE